MKINKELSIESEDINYTVKDLKISEIVPNTIDNFTVMLYEDHQAIILPSTITGVQFKSWHRGKGGIFSKDVLNYSLHKPHGKYVLIKGNKLNCIARLISEEEIELFNPKFIDGKIKDTSYMILKNLKDEESLTNVHKYIEKDIDNEEDIEIISCSNETDQDEDFDHHVSSISLFNE